MRHLRLHLRLLVATWLALALFLLCIAPSPPPSPGLSSSITAGCTSNGEAEAVKQVVSVVVVGATGDLAAKYLWVALFRLALQADTSVGRSYRFVAGASDSHERGEAWRRAFFDETFARRVCGASELPDQDADAFTACRSFLEETFKPSVRYVPLWREEHYLDLAAALHQDNDHLASGSEEVGRLVYLAIPPQFFLQTCELVHSYLRPRVAASSSSLLPFLRVVVEKPFGHDLPSARALATQLRGLFNSHELYVMDHYAGKTVVHALRSYLQLNAAKLHPIWNTQHIRDVKIEMAETATVENRVHYFHNTGIIRDVMVNHLQLLLGVVASPSFTCAEDHTPAFSSPSAVDWSLHKAQLQFTASLQWPYEQQSSLLVAQYQEYDAHYRLEMGEDLGITTDSSSIQTVFTPTAAMVELCSSLDVWNATSFRLSAAKASLERLLVLSVTFRKGAFSSDSGTSCVFTVIIQRSANADTRQSHRIEWSCDADDLVGTLQSPEGWTYASSRDHGVLTPEKETTRLAWELGDEPSAYDVLLSEVDAGNTEHFADLDDIEAAWALWTPIVHAAETLTYPAENKASGRRSEGLQRQQPRQIKAGTYGVGTSPWQQFRPPSTDSGSSEQPDPASSIHVSKSPLVKEEL